MDFRLISDDYDLDWIKKAIALIAYLLLSKKEAFFIKGEAQIRERMKG